ncbi:uncharacterized protein LOC128957716 [Oppia nitens]|uniref:uncharacterized protein LOC128957716 n=1 Tax=Oppia nitens TaxID=1686743 RepID=UPI0023DA0F72|nr:uncharacterized protein LOC128957716 [Oppia nitens]
MSQGKGSGGTSGGGGGFWDWLTGNKPNRGRGRATGGGRGAPNRPPAPAKNGKNGAKAVQSPPKKAQPNSKQATPAKSTTGASAPASKPAKTKSTDSDSSKRQSIELKHFSSRLTPVNTAPKGEIIYDVCAYIVYCPKHQKIAVAQETQNKYIWLPYVYLPADRTWSDGAREGAVAVLSNGDENVAKIVKTPNKVIDQWICINMFRLQLPQTQIFNTRILYYIKLSDKESDYKCCSNSGRLRWLSLEEAKNRKMPNLWGPELCDFATLAGKKPKNLTIVEYSLDKAFSYVPRDPPRNLEEEMLKSTNYSEKDIERLYLDYMEHCFPAFYMTLVSFSDYMSKYGFEKMDKKLDLLFRAFNYQKNGFLDFHEFLLGLTSIDPMAKNGQSRIKFIFKYFDLDGDGYLNKKEFTSMVTEIYPKESTAAIDAKVSESMKIIGQKPKGVFFEDFNRAVGAHKFRGTHNLCRSNRPIVQQISRSMASRTLHRTTTKLSLESMLKIRKYKGICSSCHEKKYEYAIHSVHMMIGGQCANGRKLPELEQISSSADGSDKTEKEKSDKEKSNKEKEKEDKHADKSDKDKSDEENPDKEKSDKEKSDKEKSDKEKSDKESSDKSKQLSRSTSTPSIMGLSSEKFSEDIVWNPKSIANYFIQKIREFNTIKGTHRDGKGLQHESTQREAFVKLLEELCAQIGKIVANEDRCARASSPAFIIGDIHGNLEDLLTMERVLWKNLPLVTANYVFLGDYVDRGQWGLECAIYIMCMKMLAPNKIVMLRGNHEVRELQRHYTYYRECCRKYGDSLGSKVFEMTNRVFDRLPFCAVIDDAIYCAHGGIPHDSRLIDEINKQGNDLRNPETDSSVCWQILWSDPCSQQVYIEAAELQNIKPESAKGFLPNQKRGTAYLFAEEAANNFLQHNGLTHIVRAHEVPAKGFTFHFGQKCTTIFSSSHYCGNNNEAAVIHVDNEKLRIVRLDTVNNAPASE